MDGPLKKLTARFEAGGCHPPAYGMDPVTMAVDESGTPSNRVSHPMQRLPCETLLQKPAAADDILITDQCIMYGAMVIYSVVLRTVLQSAVRLTGRMYCICVCCQY